MCAAILWAILSIMDAGPDRTAVAKGLDPGGCVVGVTLPGAGVEEGIGEDPGGVVIDDAVLFHDQPMAKQRRPVELAHQWRVLMPTVLGSSILAILSALLSYPLALYVVRNGKGWLPHKHAS